METLNSFKVSIMLNYRSSRRQKARINLERNICDLYLFGHNPNLLHLRSSIQYFAIIDLNCLIMKFFRSTSARLFQYFLQGVLVLAPIGITIYLIVQIFRWLDGLLPIYINLSPAGEKPFYLPGIGFLLVIGTVLLVGYLSSLFFIGRVFHLFDYWLEKTPGVKLIYTLVKDFSEAMVGKKRKFTKTVLVNIYDKDVWQLGFITNEDLEQFELKNHISVYVPLSYALTGTLFFVTRDRVRLLPKISGPDAYKFAISGGVAEVED